MSSSSLGRRQLHTFRVNAGLSSTAQPVGGWEGPGVELPGHSMGHLLSAPAQAYAVTGDSAFKTKGDYLVGVLAAVGNAEALTVVTNMAGWVDSRTGRLSYAQMQSVLNTEFGG